MVFIVTKHIFCDVWDFFVKFIIYLGFHIDYTSTIRGLCSAVTINKTFVGSISLGEEILLFDYSGKKTKRSICYLL